MAQSGSGIIKNLSFNVILHEIICVFLCADLKICESAKIIT